MGKRLLIGLIKGLALGLALGAAFHFGLGWTATPGLLGYLLSMGAGGTAGVVAGRPPWHQEAWLEGVLKAAAGVGVGALLFWLATSFASAELPFALPGTPGPTRWNEAPLLYMPAVTSLYGALVELDNTGDGGDSADATTPRNRRKDSPSPSGD